MHINELRERRVRFTSPAAGPDLSVVGTSNYAPSSHPLHLITVTQGGGLTYERLFADRAADGSAVAYYYPGTFGALVPAGKGWRG
jgi:hypothetical protein